MKVWTSARSLLARLFAREDSLLHDDLLAREDDPAGEDGIRAWEAPAAPEPAPEEPDEGFSMLHELLDEIDAPMPSPDPAVQLTRKNATIATLQDLLSKLRPMGEQVGELEHARHAAEERARAAEQRLDGLLDRVAALDEELDRARRRAAELAEQPEGEDARDGSVVRLEERCKDQARRIERLERRLREREAVLGRERERHAATRAKLEERRALAAQRWHELQQLRRSQG